MNLKKESNRKMILPFILLWVIAGCQVITDEKPITLSDMPEASSTATALKVADIPTSTIKPSQTQTSTPTQTPTGTFTNTPILFTPVLWAEWQLSYPNNSVAWSPDSKYVVFSDDNIRGLDDWSFLYEIETRNQVWKVNHGAGDLLFSPNGDYIVDTSRFLNFWDATSGKVDGPYIEGNAIIYATFKADDNLLMIGRSWIYGDESANSAIGFWNDETKSLIDIIEVEGLINDFEISSDGRLLATTMGLLPDPETGKHVFLWDLSSKTKRCDFLGESAIFDPESNHIAIIDRDGKITLSDTVTCQPLKIIYDAGYIDSFTFSPDGRMFAIAGIPWGKIKIFDTTTHELLFAIGKLDGARTRSLTFSPDGRFLSAIKFRKTTGSESKVQHMIEVWKLPEIK